MVQLASQRSALRLASLVRVYIERANRIGDPAYHSPFDRTTLGDQSNTKVDRKPYNIYDYGVASGPYSHIDIQSNMELPSRPYSHMLKISLKYITMELPLGHTRT